MGIRHNSTVTVKACRAFFKVAVPIPVMLLFFVLCQGVCARSSHGKGPRLWVEMKPSDDVPEIATRDRSVIATTAVRELSAYWRGGDVSLIIDNSMPDNDGFKIEWAGNRHTTVVRARRSSGLLYGAYEMLRVQQTAGCSGMPLREGVYTQGKHGDVPSAHVTSSFPAFGYRLLDYCDNTVSRADSEYSGNGLLQWDEINGGKGTMSIDLKERLTAYARANASIGINGSVLNGQEASPLVLKSGYINKIRVVAASLRPYGVKTYLSISLDSPVAVGGLGTTDPLDANVKDWWKKKVKEIYAKIPDFGGFVVNAGYGILSGHAGYRHSCVDGVNMLAGLVAPYGGIVMWRCSGSDSNEGGGGVVWTDTDMKSLDGKLASNVILQFNPFSSALNPHEPYTRMFGRLKNTPMIIELQVTQNNYADGRFPVSCTQTWKDFFHLIYIRLPLWRVDSRMGLPGLLPGSPRISGLAGTFSVDNIVARIDTSYVLSNWYAFGRLAWNPSLSSDSIADEWYKQAYHGDSVLINQAALENKARDNGGKGSIADSLRLTYVEGCRYAKRTKGARGCIRPEYGAAPFSAFLRRSGDGERE